MKERITENTEKIKLNNQLPYLVANIVEVLDVDPEEEVRIPNFHTQKRDKIYTTNKISHFSIIIHISDIHIGTI